jgi:hypothetical protein
MLGRNSPSSAVGSPPTTSTQHGAPEGNAIPAGRRHQRVGLAACGVPGRLAGAGFLLDAASVRVDSKGACLRSWSCTWPHDLCPARCRTRQLRCPVRAQPGPGTFTRSRQGRADSGQRSCMHPRLRRRRHRRSGARYLGLWVKFVAVPVRPTGHSWRRRRSTMSTQPGRSMRSPTSWINNQYLGLPFEWMVTFGIE